MNTATNDDQQPSILPPPQTDGQSSSAQPQANYTPEPHVAAPVPQQTTPTTPSIPPPIPTPPVTNTRLTGAPDEAQDNDLIEQEWVDKAKAIVEHTKDNPYEQNKEINKFKADYINKRYKRQIKINEE